MELYLDDRTVAQEKENGSPVTQADLRSAEYIEAELARHGTIPIVCEESVTYDAVAAPMYWLVDPLDGTKEFLARNGEFTINVGLVCDGIPVVGVIGVPATGDIYTATFQGGAALLRGGKSFPLYNRRQGGDLVAAVSRSHAAPSLAERLQALGVTKTISCGSALKFCRLAEGVCDLYLRMGRTMEWDTAAGHCILNESGCRIAQVDDGTPLWYGKEEFANPSFIACRADLDISL